MNKRIMCRDSDNRLYCFGTNLTKQEAIIISLKFKRIYDKVWIEDEGMFTEHEPKGVSNGNKR